MRKTALSEIPVLEHVGQSSLTMRKHALRVYRYRNDVEAPRLHGLDCIHINEFLAEYALALADPVPTRIPGVGKGFNGLGESVGRTAREEGVRAAGIRDIRMKMVAGKLADEIGHNWEAFSCSILKGCGKINFL